MTRLGRALALTACITGALATPVGGRVIARACAAGDVHIAVVVDAGTGGTVSAVCVPGSTRDNGATILAARASMLGMPQPRYSSSGLLCSIDGLPATGCGVAHGGRYAYWSYWHGSAGKWSYSSFGPSSGRVDAGIVEGWRWQPDGSGLPTDPPPRGPAGAETICVPPPAPTTTPPTSGATTPPPTAPIGPSPTVGVQQTPITSPPNGPHPSTAESATTRPSPNPMRGGTTTTRGAHPSTGASARSTSSSIVLAARGVGALPRTRSSGGAPVGLIIGVPLVIVLGGGGAIAARRRARAAS